MLCSEKSSAARWIALLVAALLVLTVALTSSEQSSGNDPESTNDPDEADEKGQPSTDLTEEEKSSAADKANSLLRVQGLSRVGLAN